MDDEGWQVGQLGILQMPQNIELVVILVRETFFAFLPVL